jgi:hypothetical protein
MTRAGRRSGPGQGRVREAEGGPVTVRRRKPAGPAVPERFARFAVSEWPGLGCEDAVWAWAAGREVWALAHPVEWPPGYPTTPLGDKLDRLKARHEAWLMTCTEPEPEPEASNGHGGWLWPHWHTAGPGSDCVRPCSPAGSGSARLALGASNRSGRLSGSTWAMRSMWPPGASGGQ